MGQGDEISRLRVELATAQDLVLRVAAEQENIRKRAARDIEQAHRFALEKFAQELLPVRDSLELAVANARPGRCGQPGGGTGGHAEVAGARL